MSATNNKTQGFKRNLVFSLSLAVTTLMVSSCSSLAVQNKPVKAMPLSFSQGTALPYQVLNNQWVNTAYPNKKLEIRNGGFGSDAAAHPTNAKQFYALTDRGPNADFSGSAGDGKQFLTPSYTPRIGLFELQDNGYITQVREILLKDRAGHLISGLPNPKALGGTNEMAYDGNGELILTQPTLGYDKTNNPTKTDKYGLDSEGLAALKDGSFWVSDEYGPHIVHYDSSGNEIGRINAFAEDDRNTVIINGRRMLLPNEFAKRRANRGMEGLTITPDQSTLVGIMQSSMDNPDKSGRKTDLTRIVTLNLVTGKVAQYLYRQDIPQNSNSGIVALNDHEFYVIERDGGFALQGNAVQKQVYKIDISGATDIETIKAQGNIQQDERLGLLINGQTLEQFIAADSAHWAALSALGIKPVSKRLSVDAVKTLNYPHDKLEGLWLRQDGTLGLLNDDDFATWSTDNRLEQKYLDNNKTIEDTNRLYIVKPMP